MRTNTVTQEEVLPHEEVNLQLNPVLVPPTQTAHFSNSNNTDIDHDVMIIMSDIEGQNPCYIFSGRGIALNRYYLS